MGNDEHSNRDMGQSGHGSHVTPGRHRYAAADAELSGYFTSAVGLKGQAFESGGGHAFDAAEASAGLLREMRWLSASASPIAFVDRVAATLAQLAPEHRITLALVYTPHAWPATWMASALASPWGGGSMAALALTLPRAAQGLRRWLLEVDRPKEEERRHRETMCGRLVREGDVMRMAAITAYDVVRVERVAGVVKAARQAKADRQKANEARLAEELGMDLRIRRARAERSHARRLRVSQAAREAKVAA